MDVCHQKKKKNQRSISSENLAFVSFRLYQKLYKYLYFVEHIGLLVWLVIQIPFNFLL